MFCERKGSLLWLLFDPQRWEYSSTFRKEFNSDLISERCGIVLINVTEVIDDVKTFPWFANYPDYLDHLSHDGGRKVRWGWVSWVVGGHSWDWWCWWCSLFYCLIEQFRVLTENCGPETGVWLWLVLTVDSNPLISAWAGRLGARGPSSARHSSSVENSLSQHVKVTAPPVRTYHCSYAQWPHTQPQVNLNLLPGEGEDLVTWFTVEIMKINIYQFHPPTKFYRPLRVIIKAKKVFAHLPSSRPHKLTEFLHLEM